MMKDYPEEFLDKLQSVRAKRAKTVIDLILKNGYATTEDIAKAGYEHAPRAVRDVRELGIPIITTRTKDTNGKSIASYSFGNPYDVKNIVSKKAGRTVQLNKLRHALVEKYGARCSIYLEEMDESDLQVDHRVPYEIGGEHDIDDLEAFMLLSPSANRRKSWTCEHCENWQRKDAEMCQKCFWAFPDRYTHVAGKEERIIITHLIGKAAEEYDKMVLNEGREKNLNIIKESIVNYTCSSNN